MKTINVNHMKNIIIDKYDRKNKIKLTPIKIVTNNELKEKISNYNYLETFLHFDNHKTIYKINSKELLSPINYDIFIKYLYFKNINNKDIKKIYLNHIKTFNNFKEPDGSKKNKKDFLTACNNLLDNYNYSSIIPISNQGIIIDGSHRIALSIIKNQKVLCTIFNTEDLYFDFTFFKKRGFPQKYMDFIGFSIINLIDNISCSIINFNNKEEIYEIITNMKKEFDIYYYTIKNNKILFLLSNSKKIFYQNSIMTSNKEKIIEEYKKFISKWAIKRYEEDNILC